MADSIPDKSYFRIGEVSKMLGVAPHVIRYWESEFISIRPIRAKSDQRLYRKKDVEELMLVRSLLYDQKFTISGAKKRLSEIKGHSASAEHQREILSEIKQGLQEIKGKLAKRT